MTSPTTIINGSSQLLLWKKFSDPSLFNVFYEQLEWTQGKVFLFGEWKDEPRLSCFYGDEGISYIYSGRPLEAKNWTPELKALKHDIELYTGHTFNTALGNFYKDGTHHMGWHCDDEPELGHHPPVASFNLGGTRKFSVREKTTKKVTDIFLEQGDLLLMSGTFQRDYHHCLRKTAKAVEPRINLTFRNIIN